MSGTVAPVAPGYEIVDVDGTNIRVYREGTPSEGSIVYLHSASGEVCSLPFFGLLGDAGYGVDRHLGFATLGIGAYLVFAGAMTMGQLVAFYTLFGQVSVAVTSLTCPIVPEANRRRASPSTAFPVATSSSSAEEYSSDARRAASRFAATAPSDIPNGTS